MAWCTKYKKCGGSNLTHINFANISGEVKFVDILKYYQKSLAELLAALSDEEKKSCEAINKTSFKLSLFSRSLVFSREWTEKKGSWYYCRWKRNSFLWKNHRYKFTIFNSRERRLFWENRVLQWFKEKSIQWWGIWKFIVFIQNAKNEKFRRNEWPL